MPVYRAPIDDYLFILSKLLRVQDRVGLPGYADLTPELCADIVQAAARFHEEVVFPVGSTGDAEGARLVDGAVRTPTGYPELWRAYREAGWLSISLPESIGGGGFPAVMAGIVGEMRITAAHSWAMYVGFCASAAPMLNSLGDQWMREHVVPRLVSGEWTATMCLTESHCGSDLRQIRTQAVAQADGSWALNGTKVFISGGDHDLAENIVHIVLAKVKDGTRSSQKGLGEVNVFLVSKRQIDPASGALAGPNGVMVSSLEHKMGIEGSATCVLNFDNAQAWRVADPGGCGTAANMAPMFHLMNHARVNTALSGVGYAELAAQNARIYARERLAGRAPQGPRHPDLPGDPLVVHPDIRRLLLGAQSFAEGARATALRTLVWQAESQSAADEDKRAVALDLMELMTPVMKAFFTDRGFSAANDCLQVLGGHGYIREYGLEQMVRNARIGQIYEGANGVQAIDLTMRKLPARAWRPANNFLAQIDAFIEQRRTLPGMNDFLGMLAAARGHLACVFDTLRDRGDRAPEANLAAACDVLECCGIVAVAWTWAETVAVLLEDDSVATEMHRRKMVLARFWFERELPKLAFLAQRIGVDHPSMLELEDHEV
jgi:alkylation response protein AidB-like acyl-CoA dehydrogenase